MPKITYPRPCPTCGKELSSGYFFQHKKRCGTLEHRVQCPLCPLTFGRKDTMQYHVRQQHSNNPLRFSCTICHKEFCSSQKLKIHVQTVHAAQKPCYRCWYCNARFTRHFSRQTHMRRVHGRICREQEINLHLHLQHFSEEDDFQDEWMFVESRPIQSGEHNVCPCGQTPIHSFFFLENKINGNRSFVGSECIRNIDPKAAAVIGYFKHILGNEVQGFYKGQDDQGLQTFAFRSNTILVRSLYDVEHLNPPLIKNLNRQWEVSVIYPKANCLLVGQTYSLRLKAKYQRGRLHFTAV